MHKLGRQDIPKGLEGLLELCEIDALAVVPVKVGKDLAPVGQVQPQQLELLEVDAADLGLVEHAQQRLHGVVVEPGVVAVHQRALELLVVDPAVPVVVDVLKDLEQLLLGAFRQRGGGHDEIMLKGD